MKRKALEKRCLGFWIGGVFKGGGVPNGALPLPDTKVYAYQPLAHKTYKLLIYLVNSALISYCKRIGLDSSLYCGVEHTENLNIFIPFPSFNPVVKFLVRFLPKNF